MGERERHRVAVAVFMDVEGVDYADAVGAATMLIRRALKGDDWLTPFPKELTFTRMDGVSWTGQVTGVMDVGMAAGNGYLWTEPTSKMWRESGL